MLQAFLLVSIACAEYSSIQSSNLSPLVNISLPDFNQSFNALFSEQVAVLNQADTIKARIEFKNDLYEYKLAFKVLFPVKIQYQLLNAVKQNLLKNLSEQEILEIRVEYVSDDYMYQLFNQQGEKNLNDLIGNDKLKKALLPPKISRNWSGYTLKALGLNTPRIKKNETQKAYKKRIDPIVRRWLLKSVLGVTGYTRKQLKEKTTGALWIMFYRYKLCHEFGYRLFRDINDNRPAEFKVNIAIKNKEHIEAYIAISGEDYNMTVNQTKGLAVELSNVADLLEMARPLSFDERIRNLKNTTEEFKGEMHTLQSQTRDMDSVIQAIDLLKRIKNIDLADWQNGVLAATKDKVKQELISLDAWLAQSPEYFQNRLQEKYQAHLLIDQIVKARGKIAYNDFTAVIDNITEAITCLEARIIFLFEGISKRNASLFKYAVESKDDYFYGEVIKNTLNISKAAVENDLLIIALGNIEYLESEILAESTFENKRAAYQPAIEAISLLRNKLDKADNAKSASTALRLINQVEADKQQAVAGIIESLTQAKKWVSKRKLTYYEKELDEVIDGLGENTGLYTLINSALNKLNNLIKKVNNSPSKKMDSEFRQLIIKQFILPKQRLNNFGLTVLKRNDAIKKTLPGYKLVSLDQTVADLENDFQQKSGYDSYAQLQTDLLEQMQYAVKLLTEERNSSSRRHGLVPVGELLPDLLWPINKQYQMQMIGQAI